MKAYLKCAAVILFSTIILCACKKASEAPTSVAITEYPVIVSECPDDINTFLQEQRKYMADEKRRRAAAIAEKNNYPRVAGREVYLTFDDGPGPFTDNIIKILEENGVNATFFVVGENVAKYEDVVRESLRNGNLIAPHAYRHVYKEIYTSEKAYFEDLNKVIDIINELSYTPPRFMRFPGGTNNTVSSNISKRDIMKSLVTKVKDMGMINVDWNSSGSDSDPDYTPPVEAIIQDVITYSRNRNTVVVLLHDSEKQTTTWQAVNDIIKYFKDNGYSFRTFKDISDEDLQKLQKEKLIYRRANN